ncbi:hypothetical protein HNQ51_002269 [Inhella inkyongensis]|uniref:Uncharacterized protein n=1 Tax=Inhella inkyongensis TaxID=392593 RepID=A0A840S957_9BURK|nr:hypothetical protein [Inhella inkyongensis]MBB5204950.1 hypothetical protein [Inhella inkyongensis]
MLIKKFSRTLLPSWWFVVASAEHAGLQVPQRQIPSPIVVTLGVYALCGIVLSRVVGDEFIASYQLHPALMAPMLGFPAIVVGAWITRRLREARGLSSGVLGLAAFILFSGTVAGLLFLAAQGWVALTSTLLSQRPAVLKLTVLSVRRWESRRSVCQQYLELQHGRATENLCADDFPLSGKLIAGRQVEFVGVASPVGFHVQGLRNPMDADQSFKH